jgi:hypothetical protein
VNSSGEKATAIAAIDLLLNLLMLFIVIAAIAIAKMNKPDRLEAVENKAEYLVEMTWPDGNFDDLDLWLLLPNGTRVGFNNKDVGVATLDRDDRGAYGDTYPDWAGGTVPKLIRVNKEVIAIRANLPGNYAVNVHYYNDFSSEEIGAEETEASPSPVTVKLTRLNPKVDEIVSRKLTLGKVGSQQTAFCFKVGEAERPVTVDQQCSMPFVQTTGARPDEGTRS